MKLIFAARSSRIMCREWLAGRAQAGLTALDISKVCSPRSARRILKNDSDSCDGLATGRFSRDAAGAELRLARAENAIGRNGDVRDRPIDCAGCGQICSDGSPLTRETAFQNVQAGCALGAHRCGLSGGSDGEVGENLARGGTVYRFDLGDFFR